MCNFAEPQTFSDVKEQDIYNFRFLIIVQALFMINKANC